MSTRFIVTVTEFNHSHTVKAWAANESILVKDLPPSRLRTTRKPTLLDKVNFAHKTPPGTEISAIDEFSDGSMNLFLAKDGVRGVWGVITLRPDFGKTELLFFSNYMTKF